MNEATANLGTYFPDYDGRGYEIAGFGWHQGWNDRVDCGLTAPSTRPTWRTSSATSAPTSGCPNCPSSSPPPAWTERNAYTQVELAQLEMADTGHLPGLRRQRGGDRHPQHLRGAGLLAAGGPVARGDQGYPLEPQRQDLPQHRPRDGRCDVAPGARPLPVPPACHRRIPAASPSAWQNGTETPTSVRILRNGSRDRRRRAGRTRRASSTPPPSRASSTTNFSSPCPAIPAIR